MEMDLASEPQELADGIFAVVSAASARSDVRAAVERNHDDNEWWPVAVSDWRVRMAVAGWSTRVSYSMIRTYADVVRRADLLGFDRMTEMSDADLLDTIGSLGLHHARVAYFRSLAAYIAEHPSMNFETSDVRIEELITTFQASIAFAGFKVAQCAVLYARGYHCGIIPVDSGMVTKLAPLLGLDPGRGARAHETLRHILERAVRGRREDYLALIDTLGYRVTVPEGCPPTWWVHLVLIYFKRLYLNPGSVRVCRHRPVCGQVLDCYCTPDRIISTASVLGV